MTDFQWFVLHGILKKNSFLRECNTRKKNVTTHLRRWKDFSEKKTIKIINRRKLDISHVTAVMYNLNNNLSNNFIETTLKRNKHPLFIATRPPKTLEMLKYSPHPKPHPTMLVPNVLCVHSQISDNFVRLVIQGYRRHNAEQFRFYRTFVKGLKAMTIERAL